MQRYRLHGIDLMALSFTDWQLLYRTSELLSFLPSSRGFAMSDTEYLVVLHSRHSAREGSPYSNEFLALTPALGVFFEILAIDFEPARAAFAMVAMSLSPWPISILAMVARSLAVLVIVFA